jgi:poly-gamma-glutamate synthesis protein (capsule biosynthesis protein)
VAAVRAAGIGACGVRGSDGWATDPVWLRNGEVVVLGYCLRPRQYGQTPPPYAEGTLQEICADVERASVLGATVIVSLHWGEEFVPTPSEAEIKMGRAIIDAGAAIILGHHPHVVRPVERYGSGAIVYSMGNFMGDMVWYSPFLRGEIIRCTIEDRSVKELSVIETHLRDDYQPTLGADAPTTALPEGVLRGLDAADYARAISDSISRQRRALYRSALLNLRQTPMRVLVQLMRETIRNKIAALMRPTKGDMAHVADSH